MRNNVYNYSRSKGGSAQWQSHNEELVKQEKE